MRNGNLTQTTPRNGDTIPAHPGRRRRRLVAQLLSALITAALTAATATPAFAVFNGSRADSDDYAWAVRVQLAYPEGIASCTGSLIKEDTVVTAAHCIRNNGRSPSAIDVTFHYGQKRDQYTVGVARAVPMPHYDPALIKDDIALLFLQSAVSEPTIELASTPAPVGAEVTVAGYGCTGDPFNAAEPCDPARRLIETELTTVPAGGMPGHLRDPGSSARIRRTPQRTAATAAGPSSGPITANRSWWGLRMPSNCRRPLPT